MRLWIINVCLALYNSKIIALETKAYINGRPVKLKLKIIIKLFNLFKFNLIKGHLNISSSPTTILNYLVSQ